MLNDRKASELISQSMRRELSDEERSAVEEHLNQSPATEQFARLSQVIHGSTSDIGVLAEAGDPSVGPGLSEEAKTRLKDSLFLALDQSGAAQTILESRADSGVTEDSGAASEEEAAAAAVPSSFGNNDGSDSRQVVSRYKVIKKLGEGGLGRVWLARDQRLNRTVAIKEMNARATESPRAWQRFHREAEITGHLEHPNVVPLYQFGDDRKTGNPFYAMRFVGKTTLADAVVEYHGRRLSGGAELVEWHRLLSAFEDVCQAIAYAHSRGVVHRDLKPENVALDNFGQVIVLDWGLAKLAEDTELSTRITEDQSVDDNLLAQTLAGEVIGTPLYMAPEQAAGKLEDVDERTDVYGLGAILFAILTGCAPHEDSHTSTGGNLRVNELLKAIADAEAPDPRKYNADVPRELVAICMKSLSRERYARFSSAKELSEAVQSWMAGQAQRNQEYENLRMDGMELRTRLASAMRDLNTNVRFMANLPPIQAIIDVAAGDGPEDEKVWRERLAQIYVGLLQANSAYTAVCYCRVDDEEMSEIVRVERHSTETSNVRKIPRSRLASGPVDGFVRAVMRQNPDEVYVCLNPNSAHCASTGVRAGVPIFDERTEDVFGLVVIESGCGRLLRTTVESSRRSTGQILIVDGGKVIHHDDRDGSRVQPSIGADVGTLYPGFDKVAAQLKATSEFVDTNKREAYATTLKMGDRQEPLTVLLVNS